ncbi:hypothetical protein BC629DRAFT_1638953 [Irpex lacteus]|nr:hypothetical protein BC629DRAFT_1638953 [Irpex lacteus]
MFASLRSVKAAVLRHNTDADATAAILKEGQVPVAEDPCRACADPLHEALRKTHAPPATPPAPARKAHSWCALYSRSKEDTVLNGSHHTISETGQGHRPCVTDYKVVAEVERSSDGSHKKRDNRCHIAAPKLEHGLSVALEQHDGKSTPTVEHDLEHKPSDNDDAEAAYLAQLKDAAESKRRSSSRYHISEGTIFRERHYIYPNWCQYLVRPSDATSYRSGRSRYDPRWKVIPELLRGDLETFLVFIGYIIDVLTRNLGLLYAWLHDVPKFDDRSKTRNHTK